MNKSSKILILACFLLVVILGFYSGFIYQDYLNDKESFQVLNNSSTSTVLLNQTSPNNQTQTSQPTKTQPQNEQVVYGGENYDVYDSDDFVYTGEAVIICPKCGREIMMTAHETRGNYWYYFFKCLYCNGKFANYAKAQ